jgi:Co/Zn/Cd efflux system component
MFGIEIVGGLKAVSVSLLAHAADFLGDAANFGLSLKELPTISEATWGENREVVRSLITRLYHRH